MPTGTMANQIALRLLGTPGTRVVGGRSQHVVAYERGRRRPQRARPVRPRRRRRRRARSGRRCAGVVEASGPGVSAVVVENTHMEAGGRAVGPRRARRRRRPRAVPSTWTAPGCSTRPSPPASRRPSTPPRATAVMACLSKGLGAPVGSLLAARADDVERARLERKRLGGAMRQAGVLAAPGLVALRQNVDRLADDHARARRLAEAVAERWPGALDPDRVRTNIVVFRHPDAEKVIDHLAGDGVLAVPLGPAGSGSSPTSTSTTPASSGRAARWPAHPEPDMAIRLDRLQPSSAPRRLRPSRRPRGLVRRHAGQVGTGRRRRPPRRRQPRREGRRRSGRGARRAGGAAGRGGRRGGRRARTGRLRAPGPARRRVRERPRPAGRAGRHRPAPAARGRGRAPIRPRCTSATAG